MKFSIEERSIIDSNLAIDSLEIDSQLLREKLQSLIQFFTLLERSDLLNDAIELIQTTTIKIKFHYAVKPRSGEEAQLIVDDSTEQEINISDYLRSENDSLSLNFPQQNELNNTFIKAIELIREAYEKDQSVEQKPLES